MFIIYGLLSGIIMPCQTSINTRLQRSVLSPFMASLVSFFVGTVFLAAIVLVRCGGFGFPMDSLAGAPWWIWTGGCLGVVMLTTNVVILPYIGAVQTVILPVTGMILMSMVIDHFGLFGGARIPFGVSRLAGCALVLAGALLAAAGGRRGDGREGGKQRNPWGWRLLGFVGGLCGATQATVNGRLGGMLGTPLKSALVSFTVGTLTLAVIVLVTRRRVSFVFPPASPKPWWMWTGGLIGANTVFSSALLAPLLGTGMTIVLNQCGMMAGGLLIDRFGWFETEKQRVSGRKILAVILVLSGVALIHGL